MIIIIFVFLIFQTVTDSVWITDIGLHVAGTNDSKLLEVEFNLRAASQGTTSRFKATASKGLATGPYEPAIFLAECAEITTEPPRTPK